MTPRPSAPEISAAPAAHPLGSELTLRIERSLLGEESVQVKLCDDEGERELELFVADRIRIEDDRPESET